MNTHLVEVTSPAHVEKVRSTTSDSGGQYRITNLPVGTYAVTFTLEGFSKQQRDDVVLTTGFTAPVNATMTVGQLVDTVTVVGEARTVDVQNARQVATLAGADIRDLPTTRNIRSILTLTPGLTATGLGADCVGASMPTPTPPSVRATSTSGPGRTGTATASWTATC